VRAIESDDYDNLTISTFTRGYLRAYARLVDLDEEEVILLYNVRFSVNENDVSIGRHVDKDLTAKDLPVQLASYVIGIGMFVLISLWWINNSDEDGENLYSINPDDLMDSAAKTATNVVLVDVLEEKTASTEIDVSPINEVSESQVDALAESSDVHEAAITVAKAADVAVMNVSVAEASWIEIIDAEGDKLLYELLPAGAGKEIEGQLPFTVFLGYALGVEIRINGNRFNHAPFQRRNNTARFEIN